MMYNFDEELNFITKEGFFMRKAAIKGYIAGILTMILISGTVLMASPVTRDIVFGVNVSVDGNVVQFEDDMRPFIMEGRTFLPVRAIADIAGFDVDFDGVTNTVLLRTGDGLSATQSTPDLSHSWGDSSDDRVVWTANATSQVIHRISTCSNMASPVETTIGEALSRVDGGRPCQVCWAD